jgi:hypothetical protein
MVVSSPGGLLGQRCCTETMCSMLIGASRQCIFGGALPTGLTTSDFLPGQVLAPLVLGRLVLGGHNLPYSDVSHASKFVLASSCFAGQRRHHTYGGRDCFVVTNTRIGSSGAHSDNFPLVLFYLKNF